MAYYDDLGGRYSDYEPNSDEDHKVCTSECAARATPCPPRLIEGRRSQPKVACPHCHAPAGAPCVSSGRHPHRLRRPHPSRLEAA